MLNVLALKKACMYGRWKFVSLNKSLMNKALGVKLLCGDSCA
jgi:hypothetical protein